MKLSAGDLAGCDNNHLDIINNICEHCDKGQNGVIIDDQVSLIHYALVYDCRFVYCLVFLINAGYKS